MATSANTFEAYLQGLRLVRGTGAGVNERSYYAPLHGLLDAVGKTLKPNVGIIGLSQGIHIPSRRHGHARAYRRIG